MSEFLCAYSTGGEPSIPEKMKAEVDKGVNELYGLYLSARDNARKLHDENLDLHKQINEMKDAEFRRYDILPTAGIIEKVESRINNLCGKVNCNDCPAKNMAGRCLKDEWLSYLETLKEHFEDYEENN